MTETIKKSIDNGKFGCGIFIHLKKAFDTVNHTVLLKKPEHYGIRGIPSKWFESYLIKYETICLYKWIFFWRTYIKTWCTSKFSPWSITVFNLYKWLTKCVQTFNLLSFCWWYKYLFESTDLLQIQKAVNRELQKVRKWLEANRLTLNIERPILLFSIHSSIKLRIILYFGLVEKA